MRGMAVAAWLLAWAGAAMAQAPVGGADRPGASLPGASLPGASLSGPSLPGPSLSGTVRLGTLATLAPLCGLRDEGWAFDLRRAAMQSATRAERPDDPSLKAAPGSGTAAAALGYAEAEALEDFAEAPAAVTCGPLSRDGALAEADQTVEEFRRRVAALSGS